MPGLTVIVVAGVPVEQVFAILLKPVVNVLIPYAICRKILIASAVDIVAKHLATLAQGDAIQ